MRRARSRRAGRLLTVASGVVGAALLAAALMMTIGNTATAAAAPHDLNGNAVVLDPDTTPKAAVAEQMNATTETGARFVVPSVGLDVPLGALTMVDDVLTPPGFTSAYLVRNLGVSPADAADGTVFVVMHSIRGGAVGPGNYLIDVKNQTSRVEPGATVMVGAAIYKVTTARAIAKTVIGKDTGLWGNTPGRLVVITCLQRPHGSPAVDDLVITASLARS